jgi:hypothetical protein
MKVRIFYNKRGTIVGIVRENEDPNAPRVNVESGSETNNILVDLSGDVSKLSLLEIHSKYRIDLKEKKLKLAQINESS